MILVLSAFATEQADLLACLQNPTVSTLGVFRVTQGKLDGLPVVLALTGMGLTNAAAVTSALISLLKPQTVIFYGCAGGIRHDLNVGDIIVGSDAFEIDVLGHHAAFHGTPYFSALINPHRQELTPEKFQASTLLLESVRETGIRYYQETLVSSNAFPIAMHYFNMLKTNKYACIDMESAAVYQVCWLHQVPALVVRTIGNFIDDEGNEDTTDETLSGAMKYLTDFIKASIESISVTIRT